MICRQIILPYIDCETIISSFGKDSKIIDVNTTATLKWNLNGVPSNATSGYNVYKFKNDDKIRILTLIPVFNNTVSNSLDYFKSHHNPFQENRIRGHLNLTNGNGTLIVKLLNAQYNESGVFSFEYHWFNGGKREEINSTLDVQCLF